MLLSKTKVQRAMMRLKEDSWKKQGHMSSTDAAAQALWRAGSDYNGTYGSAITILMKRGFIIRG